MRCGERGANLELGKLGIAECDWEGAWTFLCTKRLPYLRCDGSASPLRFLLARSTRGAFRTSVECASLNLHLPNVDRSPGRNAEVVAISLNQHTVRRTNYLEHAEREATESETFGVFD